MIQQTVYCDICGNVKGDVNQWWVIDTDYDDEKRVCKFVISPANGKREESCEDVCSQQCATVALQRWMTEVVDSEREKEKEHERTAVND